MTLEKLTLILNSLTTWLVIAILGGAMLLGKLDATTAILPMLAAAGIEHRNLKARREASAHAQPPPSQVPPGAAGALLAAAIHASQFI